MHVSMFGTGSRCFSLASRLGSYPAFISSFRGNSAGTLKLTACLPLLAWIRAHVADSLLSRMSLLCSI